MDSLRDPEWITSAQKISQGVKRVKTIFRNIIEKPIELSVDNLFNDATSEIRSQKSEIQSVLEYELDHVMEIHDNDNSEARKTNTESKPIEYTKVIIVPSFISIV